MVHGLHPSLARHSSGCTSGLCAWAQERGFRLDAQCAVLDSPQSPPRWACSMRGLEIAVPRLWTRPPSMRCRPRSRLASTALRGGRASKASMETPAYSAVCCSAVRAAKRPVTSFLGPRLWRGASDATIFAATSSSVRNHSEDTAHRGKRNANLTRASPIRHHSALVMGRDATSLAPHSAFSTQHSVKGYRRR